MHRTILRNALGILLAAVIMAAPMEATDEGEVPQARHAGTVIEASDREMNDAAIAP